MGARRTAREQLSVAYVGKQFEASGEQDSNSQDRATEVVIVTDTPTCRSSRPQVTRLNPFGMEEDKT